MTDRPVGVPLAAGVLERLVQVVGPPAARRALLLLQLLPDRVLRSVRQLNYGFGQMEYSNFLA